MSGKIGVQTGTIIYIPLRRARRQIKPPRAVMRLNALAKRARAAALADEDLRPSLRKKIDAQPPRHS